MGHIRALLCGVAMIAAASMPASADEQTPDRRAHDGFSTWNLDDHFGGFNHFHIELWGPGGGIYTSSITHIEVTTRSYRLDGSVWERRFAAAVRRPVGFEDDAAYEGRGGFTRGPCAPCGPYDMLFFALPSDFGGLPTTVDARLSLPQAEGDCLTTVVGPCGGSVAGYHNDGSIILVTYTPDSTDAGDAIPRFMSLR